MDEQLIREILMKLTAIEEQIKEVITLKPKVEKVILEINDLKNKTEKLEEDIKIKQVQIDGLKEKNDYLRKTFIGALITISTGLIVALLKSFIGI